MSNHITFRGARIRYVDLRFEPEAGVFARFHIQALLSQPVSDAMQWDGVPKCLTTAKLVGALTARNLILTPNDKALKQHEIEMECSEVSDFAVIPEKNDDDEVTGHKLNFIARSIEPGAVAKAEQYLRTVGAGEAALKVGYEKQEKLFPAEKPAAPQMSLVDKPQKAEPDESEPEQFDPESMQPVRNWQHTKPDLFAVNINVYGDLSFDVKAQLSSKRDAADADNDYEAESDVAFDSVGAASDAAFADLRSWCRERQTDAKAAKDKVMERGAAELLTWLVGAAPKPERAVAVQ